MSNRKCILTPVDVSVERENKEYEILTDKIVDCPNCKKNLIHIIKVKESEKKNLVVAKCPYCGEESFKCIIIGEMLLQAVENLIMFDIKTEQTQKTPPVFSSIIQLMKA